MTGFVFHPDAILDLEEIWILLPLTMSPRQTNSLTNFGRRFFSSFHIPILAIFDRT